MDCLNKSIWHVDVDDELKDLRDLVISIHKYSRWFGTRMIAGRHTYPTTFARVTSLLFGPTVEGDPPLQ
jgi:hypothetical protein